MTTPAARRSLLALYLLGAAALVGWVAGRDVAVAGDSWEYLATLQSLWEHQSPDVRPGDFAATLAVFPPDHPDGKPGFVVGDPPGWLTAPSGKPFCIHFWTMPAMAVPAKAALRWTGGSELAAVPVANAVWLAVAVGVALFAGGGPLRRRLLFVGLAAVTPVTWYVEYGGVEVFCWSLVVLGLVAFDRERFVWSGVAFALAATQNPPIAALVLLPVLGAWRLGRARAALVAGLAVVITAVPALFYLWHFGRPSLLATYADPSLISWRRTASMLFDLNQGLLPYVPVVLVAVPLAVALSIRRREWLWLPALLATAAVAAAMQTQVNWNGDGRGMLRYLVWIVPPLAWVAARGIRGWMAWSTLAWAVLIQGGILALDPPTRWQYIEQRWLAAWVMCEQPTWYDPEPEIFAERQTGEVGDLSSHLPVLFGRSNGEVTKVLLDRHCVDRIAGRFERIDPDTLAKMRAAAEAADRPAYFHPPEKAAWVRPWTIHGYRRITDPP